MKPNLPTNIDTVRDLEDIMTRPTRPLVETLSKVEGDLLVLGVGGKMGPTLARMAKRAFQEDGRLNRVIGVSRFTDPDLRNDLERAEIETIACDLLDRGEVERLPDCPNIVFMAGMKFGSSGAQAATWAMNALVPGYVAERFPNSRFVVFSSGNVYPFSAVDSGGPTEETEPAPLGEYAQSVLGRERVFEFFSRRRGTLVAIARLNYAVDLRYGVLLDIAERVWNGKAIILGMGYVNVIWQGDANRQILQTLAHCSSPPTLFNIAGPETLSVRKLAEDFGRIFQKPPKFEGEEAETALLSNASKANRQFGSSTVPVETLVQWTAGWVREGHSTLEKPTHFQTRDGKF